jgi:hypothetical protein
LNENGSENLYVAPNVSIFLQCTIVALAQTAHAKVMNPMFLMDEF